MRSRSASARARSPFPTLLRTICPHALCLPALFGSNCPGTLVITSGAFDLELDNGPAGLSLGTFSARIRRLSPFLQG